MRSGGVGFSRLAGVDVDGMIRGLHIQADLFTPVLARKGGDLGSIKGGDVLGDNFRVLRLEVDIVDAQLVVKPRDLRANERPWDPPRFCDVLLD